MLSKAVVNLIIKRFRVWPNYIGFNFLVLFFPFFMLRFCLKIGFFIFLFFLQVFFFVGLGYYYLIWVIGSLIIYSF